MTRTTFILIIIILLLVIVALVQCNCNSSDSGAITRSDTTRDTTIIYVDRVDSTVVHVPKLIKEERVRVDSFIVFEKADTAAIVADYTTKRSYSDTSRLSQGRVIVNNTVQGNRLTAQQIFLDSVKQTIITNTITHTVPEKKKNTVWFGASGSYRTDTTVQIGASLMLINKKRTGFEVGAKIDNRGNITGEVGIKIKL